MEIAICDDCISDIQELKELIRKCTKDSDHVRFFEFHSGKELMDGFRKFSIIFMDIYMEGEMEGVELVRQIRKRDPDALVAFYTAYDHPASYIIDVKPIAYLLKDSDQEHVCHLLRQSLKEVRKREAETGNVAIALNSTTYMVRPSDIVFISIHEKGSQVHLTRKKAMELGVLKEKTECREEATAVKSRIKLEEYYRQLKDYGFIYAKVSYIINAKHVMFMGKDSVTMEGNIELGISRIKKKEFDEQFTMFWACQKENKF